MPKVKRQCCLFEEYIDDLEDDSCSSSSKCENPPLQRNAANARERARMRVLSSAFGRLKTKLPNIPPDTKLSKLDTLRLATIYIKQLKTLVDNGVVNEKVQAPHIISSKSLHQHYSQNMMWPFAFNNIHSASRQLESIQTTNWEISDNLEKTVHNNNFTSEEFCVEKSKPDLEKNFTYENKCLGRDSNSCFYDSHQQQRKLSHYQQRNCCDYQQSDYYKQLQ